MLCMLFLHKPTYIFQANKLHNNIMCFGTLRLKEILNGSLENEVKPLHAEVLCWVHGLKCPPFFQ